MFRLDAPHASGPCSGAPRDAAGRLRPPRRGDRLEGMSALPTTPAATGPRGPVWAFLPLSLLLAVRAHDHPGEILQDEDITVSLPRRLGLSVVIEREIASYELAVRQGRKVDAGDVSNLVRLVLRRPDAEAILHDTGTRVATEYIRRVPRLWLSTVRALPSRVSLLFARRAARRLLRRMVGGRAVQVTRRPASVRVAGHIAAEDSNATACVLYSAALEEMVRAYAGDRPRVEQQRCATQGAPFCEWVIAEA